MSRTQHHRGQRTRGYPICSGCPWCGWWPKPQPPDRVAVAEDLAANDADSWWNDATEDAESAAGLIIEGRL